AVLQQKSYLFEAYRHPASRCPYGASTVLVPNASNLGEVLSNLQGRPTTYRKFMDLVRRVLPLVKWVSTNAISANEVEIRVWNVDESLERMDLSVPIAEAGTGVGQVLAILYVVTQSAGNLIIIDEPNSFLHPGAAKTLISILLEHSLHQF